jgi:hypothetical protein
MNQCSPSQIILSEKRVHVTFTLTRIMLQKEVPPVVQRSTTSR